MVQISFTRKVKFTMRYIAMLGLFWSSLGTAECKGGVNEMKILHRRLFTDYDPLIRPSRNYSIPTVVSIQMHVTIVLGLDTKHQLLRLRAFLRLMWTDEYLKWNPEEHGGIDHILKLQNSIWKPDILLHNAANEHDRLGHEGTYVSVSFNGVVKWEPPFSLESTCKLDMSKYPFDVSICPVHIASWMMDNQTITFTWPDVPVNLQSLMINGEYEISAAGATKLTQKFDDQFYENLLFQIRLARRPAYIVVSLLVPAIMLAALGATSFLLEPNEPEKISVSITVMLSFMVFLNFIDNNLPPTSDNVCLLVVFISTLLTLAFLSVVGNVVVMTFKHLGKVDQANLRAFNQDGDQDQQNSADATPRSQDETKEVHGLLVTDLFSVQEVQTKVASGKQKTYCWVNITPASKLNKAFLIVYCSVFVFILCLMMIMICV